MIFLSCLGVDIQYFSVFIYNLGVYQHIEGDLLGFHAVKVIGWGIDSNTSYWLVTNSWNTDWGDDGMIVVSLHTFSYILWYNTSNLFHNV